MPWDASLRQFPDICRYKSAPAPAPRATPSPLAAPIAFPSVSANSAAMPPAPPKGSWTNPCGESIPPYSPLGSAIGRLIQTKRMNSSPQYKGISSPLHNIKQPSLQSYRYCAFKRHTAWQPHDSGRPLGDHPFGILTCLDTRRRGTKSTRQHPNPQMLLSRNIPTYTHLTLPQK